MFKQKYLLLIEQNHRKCEINKILMVVEEQILIELYFIYLLLLIFLNQRTFKSFVSLLD